MQSMITNILFATDLSQNSTFAFRHAVNLAGVTGAEIHVVHAREPLSEDAKVAMEMFMLNRGSREKALDHSADLIKQTMIRRQKAFWETLEADDPDIRQRVTSIEVVEGYPAEVILRRARDMKCDLIVLGAHDHGLTHTFLGTVAKRVLRRSTIPTLVVPFNEN